MRFVYEDCSRVSLTADAVSARAGVRLLGSANLVPQLLHTRFALLLFLTAATSHGRECRSFVGGQELLPRDDERRAHARHREDERSVRPYLPRDPPPECRMKTYTRGALDEAADAFPVA